MRNTSDAISTIANGLPWQPGDNVVSCNIEFPANIYPWMRLQDYGVELRLAPATGGRILPSDLFALVDNRTKAIAISWVQFSSGFRADLATIGQFCRRHKIFFFVDAIQGLGALQLDVNANNIDAFAADAHKFLTGPEGIAILYLSDQALSMVKPSVVGWMSVKEWWRCFDAEFDYQLDYLPGALRFECGTPNTLGIHGFYAALQLILELTPARIEQYLLNLCDYLRQGLDRLGLEQHRPGSAAEASAIVCCRTPQVSPETLYHRLAERQIITAARGGWLRISPHFYNNQADIDKLLQALSEIIHSTE
jgi:selenocysteine lyase/cysteine desulfurase